MFKTVDVHNHLFPRIWLEHIEKNPGRLSLERTGPTNMIVYVGDTRGSGIYKAGHYDIGARLQDMDQCDIQTQIISLTDPGVELLPAREGVEWARKINDYFAEISLKYPGRFYAYASLPYQDVDAAARELERTHKDLKMKGVTLFSNIDGRPIVSPEFLPLYALAAEYEMPILIHPGIPFVTKDLSRQLKFNNGLFGFILDTSMAVLSLIWQGVLDKYPKLTLIHAHLGGILPYLTRRMEDSWREHHKKLGLELPAKPSDYYKRQVYVDTISGYLPAMKCCLDLVGAEHMCLGTDYAHGIGNWEEAISFVRQMGLTKKETDNILGGNAARLFKLK